MSALIYRAQKVGLANRLRALVGYQAMSYCLGIPFYLCWIPDTACRANFSSLFDSSFIKTITLQECRLLHSNNEAFVLHSHDWWSEIWKTHLSSTVAWPDYLRQVHFCLKTLQPVQSISNIVKQFSDLQGINHSAGLHIRWSDNIKEYKNWENQNSKFHSDHISKLDGFQKYIDVLLLSNSSAKLFLATDNKEIESKIKSNYGSSIISYPKKYRQTVPNLDLKQLFSRNAKRSTSVEDALVEMLLLSQCQTILGTYFSSYGKFSALWGNVEYFEVQGSSYVKSKFLADLKGIDSHSGFLSNEEHREDPPTPS